MKFHSEIFPEKSKTQISYNDNIICIGSCFAVNIGKKFSDYRFKVLTNPFGILFNPISIAKSLTRIIKNVPFDDRDLIFHDDLWHSFSHHGSFSSPDKNKTLNAINQSLVKAHHELKGCKFLFLTFGTSWVYERLKTSEVVANCHKLPESYFKRHRLGVDEIVNTFQQIIEKLREINPELQIVMTVSPVRHWKDGANGNQLSKSILLLAIDQLQKDYSCISYFPAYELILDDLRDYRFFESDLFHPSQIAIDYVWDKFSTSWLSSDAINYYQLITPVINARNHIPLYPDSIKYKSHIETILRKIETLKRQFNTSNLDDDYIYFKNKVNTLNTNT